MRSYGMYPVQIRSFLFLFNSILVAESGNGLGNLAYIEDLHEVDLMMVETAVGGREQELE